MPIKKCPLPASHWPKKKRSTVGLDEAGEIIVAVKMGSADFVKEDKLRGKFAVMCKCSLYTCTLW